MATFGERIADFFGGTDTDTQEGLHGLFVMELKNIYYAEKQAIDALGTQADAATTDEVRNAFLQHQEETRGQVMRLEQVFQSLGLDADEGACAAIDGLADDAEVIISATDSDSLTRDAGLIIAAQKVEHHEIASYGSVVTLARVMGHTEVARMLQQTLEEEKNTDRKLTQLAELFINERASDESGNMGSDNMNSSSYSDSSVRADGVRYADQGSAGNDSTFQSGQSYSGSQTGNRDATLGGTMGI